MDAPISLGSVCEGVLVLVCVCVRVRVRWVGGCEVIYLVIILLLCLNATHDRSTLDC